MPAEQIRQRTPGRRGTIALLSAAVALSSCGRALVAPFWEIEDASLPYIAMIRSDPDWGVAVVYNPVYCEQVGDACGFFRAHAYAHHKLNHTLLVSPAHYPALQEEQADCYVGKTGRPVEIRAAVKFLLEVDPNSLGWTLLGDPVKRAEMVRWCAMKAGRWMGDA